MQEETKSTQVSILQQGADIAMNTKHPSKANALLILSVLKKYTDSSNRLTQKEIAEMVEKEYSVRIGRKAIKNNLMELVNIGFNLDYKTTKRVSEDGWEDATYTDWYYTSEFSDAELTYLINHILSVRNMPYKYRMEVIKKLEGLHSVHFKNKMCESYRFPENTKENMNYFLNIEILDEAILTGKKVRLCYESSKKCNEPAFMFDKKDWVVSPYELRIRPKGNFLFFSEEPQRWLGFCSIDGLTKVEILNEPALPKSEVNWLDYHNAVIDMIDFANEGEVTIFRTDSKTYNRMFIPLLTLDEKQVDVQHEGDTITVTARIREDLALFWALGYGLEILSPQSLRDKVCTSLQGMNNIYDTSPIGIDNTTTKRDGIVKSEKQAPHIIQVEPTAILSKKTCISGYKCVMCETQWGVYHVCSQDDYDSGRVVLIQDDKKIEEISLKSFQ